VSGGRKRFRISIVGLTLIVGDRIINTTKEQQHPLEGRESG